MAEYELEDMKESYGDKVMKPKKLDIELIDANAKTFYCSICYSDVEI